MGPLLCVLLAVLLPFLAVATLLQGTLRPLAAAAAYRDAAWQLGLEADTRGVSLRGRLDGRRLYVGEVIDEDGRHLQAVLDLAFPLGVGLLVRRAEDRVILRRRRPSLALSDPRLATRIKVRAFDLPRARQLLDPGVCDALTALHARWPDLELTDHWVRVALRRPPRRARDLLALVGALRGVAEAVEAARRQVPPDAALAVLAEGWAPLAADLGLSFDPVLCALFGPWEGRPLAVHVVRTADGHAADVSLGRLGGRKVGLRLVARSAVGADPEPLGRDLDTGDAAFDAAYVVQGWDTKLVLDEVDAPARSALLDLAGRGTVVAEDARVVVQGADASSADLRETLFAVRRAAEALDAPAPG